MQNSKVTNSNMVTNSNKIQFNHETLQWEGITVDQVKIWEKAYPLVDMVDVLLKKIPVWADANPRKARKRNYKRFIVNWLSRDQERREQFKKR